MIIFACHVTVMYQNTSIRCNLPIIYSEINLWAVALCSPGWDFVIKFSVTNPLCTRGFSWILARIQHQMQKILFLPIEILLSHNLEDLHIISALTCSYFCGFGTLPCIMVGIENAGNYCFLSSLLHGVLNSNEVRNFLCYHMRFHRGNILHSGKDIQNIQIHVHQWF